MYAVIKTGGKQYKVAKGDVLKVEKLDAEAGNKVELNDVLMIADGDNVTVGKPYLDGAVVKAEVNGHGRGDKVNIIKFKRRKHHLKRMGHRQSYTEVKITDITAGKGGSRKAAPAAEKAKPAAKAKKAAPKKQAKEKDSIIAKAGAVDDLTRISGVGPVLAGKLEKLGVTSFQQIADFTKEDIDRIDDELNFKGRIERDDWVKQAKAFLKEG